jgi:hypothetical protein
MGINDDDNGQQPQTAKGRKTNVKKIGAGNNQSDASGDETTHSDRI